MKQELIEKYLLNKLNDEEKKLLLNLKHNDAGFRAELEYHENLRQVCKVEDDIKFKKMISSFDEELKRENSGPQPKRNFAYRMAAAAVLLISLGILTTIFMLGKPDNNKLFAAYFEPSKNVSYPITRSDANPLTDAFIAYENKDYATASALFDDYFGKTKDTTILYYQANVLLALDKPEQAIELFSTVENSSSHLATRTHWYKALAYMKTGRKDNAMQQLQMLLKNQDGFKKKEAAKLLKALN